MTKAEVITLVEDIARVTVDGDTIDRYYADVLEEIGKWVNAPLLNVEIVEITSGTAAYGYPTNAVAIIALFHTDRHLSKTSLIELEGYSSTWRDDTGDPWAYTEDEQAKRTYLLYPEPDDTSGAMFGWNLMGADMPSDAGVVVFSERREGDIPDWIGLYITFEILARDFAKPSEYQDKAFAELCGGVAQAARQIGGLSG